MSIWTRSHRIDTNGLSHFVADAGNEDAEPALLLHGFPDSHDIWTPLASLLVAEGFRVIAPDMRGFGETGMAKQVSEYDIVTGAIPDVLGIIRSLSLSSNRQIHLIGHDFGAPVAWSLAAQAPEHFASMSAISVGHQRAFLQAGWEQKKRSLYILGHQFRGLCEAIYKANDFAAMRRFWHGHPHIDKTVAAMARPGRLTAGLNWYRANAHIGRLLRPPQQGAFGEEIVRIPTLGIWSDGDPYLGEAQMKASVEFVHAPWRYEALKGLGHWAQAEAPTTLAELLVAHFRRHSAASYPQKA